MKNKILIVRNIVFILFVIVSSLFLCIACENEKKEDILRIHIRANSNSEEDQNIKYKVKDEVVDYLTPKVIECESFEEMIDLVESEKNNIKKIADDVLIDNNFDYVSTVKINREYFPTRAYDEVTLEANFYDAIIINLGSGTGNNWWCVVYPPLCFKDTKSIVYKSKILEIINKYF